MFRGSSILLVCCGVTLALAGGGSAASLSLPDAEQSFENVDGDLTAPVQEEQASGTVPGLSAYGAKPRTAAGDTDGAAKPINGMVPKLFDGSSNPLFGTGNGVTNDAAITGGIPFKL